MSEARVFTNVEISIHRGEGEDHNFTVATVKLYPYSKTVKVPRLSSHKELMSAIENAVFELYPHRNDQF
jgi:hypothetical protein